MGRFFCMFFCIRKHSLWAQRPFLCFHSLYKEIQSQFTSTFISGIINLVMVGERTSVCFMSCSASLGSQSAVASSAYPEFDKWKKTNGLFGL